MQRACELTQNLTNKYNYGQLASVYLTHYHPKTNPKLWACNFLKNITPLTDHPDILWVELGEKDNAYKVDSPGIRELMKFLDFRAYELKKKFIIICDAHLLGTSVSNKLLKTFEELPENFCLFLLCPKDEYLLPTVESRAIKIMIPYSLNDKSEQQKSLTYSSPQELLLNLKNAENELETEKKFIEETLERNLRAATFQSCADLIEKLRSHHQGARFNNSKISRLAPFFE